MPRLVLMIVMALLITWCNAASTTDNDYRPLPYQLGQGLQFPQYGLSIGGYASLLYNDLAEQDWRVANRDLSLFITKTLASRWLIFSEIAIGDAVYLSSSDVNSQDAALNLERLYADYRAMPQATLRLGKFLTPVGHWNQIHADPLVWTASRPLTTSAPFARHATGAMLYGTITLGGNDFDYHLYFDDSDLLDPSQREETVFEDIGSIPAPTNAFKRGAGARAAYHLFNDSLTLGTSYLRMTTLELRDHKELYGFDALWSWQRMEWSSEWVHRKSLGTTETSEYGGFIQAVLPLTQHWYLVGRHERYKAEIQTGTASINTLGLTYRPHPAIVVKFEYRDGHANSIVAPSGWLGSFAVLF